MLSSCANYLSPFSEKAHDPDVAVRLETAQLLGQILEPESYNILFTLLQDLDPCVQDAALESLINLGKYSENNIAHEAVKLLGDTRVDVRSRISTLLTALGTPSLKLLLSELQSPVPLERRQAAEILGLLGDQDAGEALIEALQDNDQEVVASAAQALGRLKITSAVQSLLGAYRLYPQMGHIFAQALGHIADNRAVPFLINRLTITSGLETFAITEALGEIGHHQAIDPLLNLFSTARGMLSGMIWKSILAIAQKNQIDVIALLSSPQVLDRLNEIFQESEDQDLLPYLSKSITETSTTRGILILASQFHSFPPEIRRVLAWELGRIGTKRAIKYLAEALNDEDLLVIYQAAEALAQMENGGASDALNLMMNSDNDVKVLAAVRAIKHSKIEPFLETLNKLKTHSNPSIHRAVRQAMSAHSSN